MHILRPGLNLAHFMEMVDAAEQRLLLLDYDGTIAPFRVDPHESMPYPAVRAILTAILAAEHTRVVVISGRSIQDLCPVLRLAPLPELWGSHGWERFLPDGTYILPAIDRRARDGLAAALDWVKDNTLPARYEQKPVSLALHWRGLEADIASDLRTRILAYWQPLAEQAGLALHEFDGGIELRVPGRDKGFAVTTLLGEVAPGVAAAYLGDDLTDEDAFQAIANRGLAVLVRPEIRKTAADLWLRPPEELQAFLGAWHRVCTKHYTRTGRLGQLASLSEMVPSGSG